MNLSQYDYDLPEELIAQTPLSVRDESRLMVIDKSDNSFSDQSFKDIINYFNPGDALVLNDTKVIPARLIGYKADTNAKIELLLLRELEGDLWECLAKPAKRLKIGSIVVFDESSLKGEVISKGDEGLVTIKLIYTGILMEILDKLGTMPLPPYIHEYLDEQDRYQTIYAKNSGSAAAPTAGLHFTEDLLSSLRSKGVHVLFVTLHVGLGTFRPVNVENILEHKMHSEYYVMNDEVAGVLNTVRNNGDKIYAVGTTTTRVLETVASDEGVFKAQSGETDIFIYPGYKYKGIDGLITNFHLPKSTLLMLVSALASKELIMDAYQHAVLEKYRFFSFGDAMFIK